MKKEFRNVYYFESFNDAISYALKHDYPTDRIIHYDRGWAIQLRVSGPYVGRAAQ